MMASKLYLEFNFYFFLEALAAASMNPAAFCCNLYAGIVLAVVGFVALLAGYELKNAVLMSIVRKLMSMFGH
jgi:hypothetical protein